MYIGFLVFLIIFCMAFWMLLFLGAVVPYWIVGHFIENIKNRKMQKTLAKVFRIKELY